MQYYTLFGRQVGAHILSMATLGTLGGVSFIASRGSGAKQDQGPPVNAQSEDEEKFIREFLKNAEAEEQKEKQKA